MADLMIYLAFAGCAIIGYWVMGRLDEFISRNAVSLEEELEEQQHDSAGEPDRTDKTYPRMSVVIHFQC